MPGCYKKHAEMLADAGIDVVFFDCTNGSLTWQDSYEALMETWSQSSKDEVEGPKDWIYVAFWSTAAFVGFVTPTLQGCL